jgi:penicillin-binding protein 1A
MRRAIVVMSVVAAAAVVWAASLVALGAAWRFAGELDRAAGVAHLLARRQATIVLDRFGRPAFTFYLEQRIDVPLGRVSPAMVRAILAVEDRRFYRHHGIDAPRIVKAAWRNWRAGRIVEGGSTITQQLARAEQLSPARTFSRKIREAALAMCLEERYSKADILDAYLNTVYFGEGYYGVEAAARGYFGKAAADLAPAEAALLAGLVRSPASYSPADHPSRARSRRDLVLRLMRETGSLSDSEYVSALAAPLSPGTRGTVVGGPSPAVPCGLYYEEAVRRDLVARFGGRQVLQGGLRVYTGYDPAMQCAAERAIAARIARLSTSPAGARDLQGGLVAIDPRSGEVRSLVGGRDFAASSFDRATQARRQPGSAFKPIVYAAALELGMAPGSILHGLDAPIDVNGTPWLPGGEHEHSAYTLRTALKVSSNRAAVQLLQQVGVTTATHYAQRLGILSPLPNVPSLALGTGGVTLLELTSAYGAFANQGVAVAPHLVTRVEDRDGQLVWAADPAMHRAVSTATAFLMTTMLADVIASGTGTGVRAKGFSLPAAGKTGTSDDFEDAWFIGYTPHLVAGVWFGLDTPAPIMDRGFAAVVAVPAWAEFMKQATSDDAPDWYAPPADVETVEICRLSGLRATAACRDGWLGPDYVRAGVADLPGIPLDGGPAAERTVAGSRSNVYEEYFPIGAAPAEECHLHGAPVFDANAVAGASGVSVSPALRVERITTPDGTVGYVIK